MTASCRRAAHFDALGCGSGAGLTGLTLFALFLAAAALAPAAGPVTEPAKPNTNGAAARPPKTQPPTNLESAKSGGRRNASAC
jgi:hypothetical protein